MRTKTRFALLAMPVLAASLFAEDGKKSILEDLRMTNAEIRQTSGTLLLQEIVAREAGVAPDGDSIVAEDVSLAIRNRSTGGMIELQAPFARYYYTGEIPEEEAVVPEGPTPGELLEWKTAIDASSDETGPTIPDALRGDMLLLDPVSGEPLEISLGDEGMLTCQNLYWSRRHQRFVSIGPFEQVKREADGVFRMRGDMFVATPDFRSWSYPVLSEKSDFRMVWESNEVLQ